MTPNRHDIRRFLADADAVAAVTLASVKGSAPRDTDAWMLVAPAATFGTIGGGQLEYMAIDAARVLLAGGTDPRALDIPLGPEIGQCCGGRVVVHVERLDAAGRAAFIEAQDAEIGARPTVYIFGAGHVGHALAEALSLLPLRPVLVDGRPEALEAAADGVETSLVALPEEMVRGAEPASAFVVMTHDHALDFLIVTEALARGDARYVGMIGSRTKRSSFERWFGRETGGTDRLERLICPIGNSACADKRPAVIASFVAAEIMEHLSDAKPKTRRQRRGSAAREDANER